MKLNSTEEIIANIKQGKMVVLLDDEDRENEGDLVIAAECITKEAINFMAKFGRGLICLTLTEKKCKHLKLPLMVNQNQDLHTTNFTLSIEASKGVTTGISAVDRATTVKAAVNKNATSDDIVMPGHVFPLMAQAGGVLTRAGHTEAGCDLAHLAGLEPAAVIVEILNEDGSMARRKDLDIFAQKHKLKIGTVANLIEHRVSTEKTIERVTETMINTEFGEFNLVAFQEKIGKEVHLALIKGNIKPDKPVLVRVHMLDTIKNLLSIVKEDDRHDLNHDLKTIGQKENSILVVLRKDKNSDILNKIMLHGNGENSEHSDTLRIYGVGAQILADLGVSKMQVLGTPRKMHGLSGFGLELIEYVPY